jgi:hypothetical protein
MSDASLWLTTLLAAIISLLAIFYAVSPLLKPGKATLVLDDDKYTELLGRKDATLQAIKDLEFDYRVGKITQEDFQRLDQRLRRQAIGLLQQLEKMAPATATLDEQLEMIIAQFRKTITPETLVATAIATEMPSDMPTESNPNAEVTAQVTRFCVACGKPVGAEHKFCAHCGAPVAQPDPASLA